MFKFIKEIRSELVIMKSLIENLDKKVKPEYDKIDEIARGIDRIDDSNRHVELLQQFFEIKERISYVKDEQRKMKTEINEIHNKLDKIIEMLVDQRDDSYTVTEVVHSDDRIHRVFIDNGEKVVECKPVSEYTIGDIEEWNKIESECPKGEQI